MPRSIGTLPCRCRAATNAPRAGNGRSSRARGAERANYAAARLLTHLGSWQHYAAEPPNDLEHAKDKLAALARVMKSMREDIIEKWDWHMIHGTPSEAWENDTPPMVDPRIVETYARRDRERTR